MGGQPEARCDDPPQTGNGYKLKLSIGKSGRTGRLPLTCPDGTGRFDQSTHVTCSGSVRLGKCGSNAPDSFSQGTIGQTRMLTCPQTTIDTPFPASAPFTFTGVLPNASEGTRLRIEYTIPNSSTGLPAVAHVTTDATGGFSDTHAFPAAGFVYGAAATPRFPDDALGVGRPCTFDVL